MKGSKLIAAIPILAIVLGIFSFTEKTSKSSRADQKSQQHDQVIGQIRWEGNSRYSDDQLTEVLGIKPGDIHRKEKIENLLKYNPDRTTIGDLYMDHGHLFFNVNPKDTVISDKVVLIFEVFEGPTATIDNIIITGNEKVDTEKILKMLEISQGDLFSRAKLISSQKNISESGYFNPKNVRINPIPHDGKFVDIEFVLEEK